MTKQVVNQIEITYYDRKEEDLYTNKVGGIVEINIIEDIDIADVTLDNVHSIFSKSRSRIQFTQSGF